MNAVLNCYALIASAIRTAGNRKPDDYVFVFSKANKPLRRQERWELLRTLRTDDNEVKAKFYQGELDALSHAFDAIGQAYDVARADIVPIELPGCERATPITVACELLRSVIAWHYSDAGYWNNFPRATTDEEASEARVQLEESDSHYPISKAMANRLLEALDIERSHVLRHIAVALPQAEAPPLKDNDTAIMEQMLRMGATANSPASRETILTALRWTSEGKHAFDRLKKYGYVKAMMNTGFYLTPAGIERAKSLLG